MTFPSEQTDYQKYRGKCLEMSQALAAEDPTLRLVRSHYHCPIWGEQQHWWCEKLDGTIVDPTKLQFLSKGLGEYAEFKDSDLLYCEQCGDGEGARDFRGCDLRGSDMSGSDLRDCDFRGSDLSDCDFRNCDLRGSKTNDPAALLMASGAVVEGDSK